MNYIEFQRISVLRFFFPFLLGIETSQDPSKFYSVGSSAYSFCLDDPPSESGRLLQIVGIVERLQLVLLLHTLKNNNLINYFWLHWVFVAARAFLQLWQAGATLYLWCVGFSLPWLLLLQSMGSKVCRLCSCSSRSLEYPNLVACGLSHSVSCGIFLNQGSNLCL